MSRLTLAVCAALIVALPAPCAWSAPPPSAAMAQVHGPHIVGPDGQPLHIKSIGLGNWLVPEGYMFHLDKGPSSPRHIEQLIAALVGPDEARAFWKKWRETYVTRADLELLK